MSQSWATTMGAVRYGYTPLRLLQIEGIPTLLMEHAGDAIAPAGYAIEGGSTTVAGQRNAGLIVDKSPRLGSVADDKTAFPKALDFEARVFDTTATRALFQRPSLYTTMTADLSAAATTMNVDSTLGWSAVTKLYFGTSCATYSGNLFTQWLSLTRTTYGRARSYKAGTVVTDRPYVWKGRRVTLWFVLLDPSGRYVQGASILSNATAVWEGTIQERPTRDGAEWVIKCRDQARRLSDPLGVAASGQAVWTVDDDSLLAVDLSTTVAVKIQEVPGATLAEVQVQPFAGQSSPMRKSKMRELIASALDTAMTDARTGTPVWVQVTQTGGKRRWALQVPCTSAAYLIQATCTMTGGGAQWLFKWGGAPFLGTLKAAVSSTTAVDIPLWQEDTVNVASLSVVLDTVSPSDLPSSGWVALDGEGKGDLRRYTSVTTDTADARKALLTLDPASAPTSADIAALQSEAEGTQADVSARFLWRDSGSVPDVLRRAITSTGDAVNGAYDTLPKGQGLGLPNIDTTSFATVFDEAFKDLTIAPAADAGSSLQTMFSGLLRLSQRALVTRRAADGSAVNVAACSTGSADAGVPVATITDALLVAVGGRRPIRVRDTFAGPQAIEVRCKTLEDDKDSTIIARDPHLVDWTGERWTLDIYGLDRGPLVLPTLAWATALFRGGENRQIVELDLPPWLDIQPGDVVELSLTDPHLWNYATGAPGLSGLGRVLGVQLSLQSLVQTILVVVDGVMSSGPMAPSIPISAIAGVATTPTSIDVPSSWYNLLVRAKGAASSWKVLAYLPGQDSGRAEYTISTVTSPGGGVARLTVTAYPSSPSVTLTTSYRLTWPVVANATATQNQHLNNTDRVQWS